MSWDRSCDLSRSCSARGAFRLWALLLVVFGLGRRPLLASSEVGTQAQMTFDHAAHTSGFLYARLPEKTPLQA